MLLQFPIVQSYLFSTITVPPGPNFHQPYNPNHLGVRGHIEDVNGSKNRFQ